jgi:hypothetical protein
MKEQIQKHARKHIKGGCYLKVTLGHRGLRTRNMSGRLGVNISLTCVLVYIRLTQHTCKYIIL